MQALLAYWYHFAIMFEALFILTTIDSGTRVGRFLLQDALGKIHKPFARQDWLPGSAITTTLIILSWGYFVWIGNISTIWPMFGVANQLLGCVALAVATTIIINMGKARYSWVTLMPLAFLAVNTIYGGLLNIRDNFWPLAVGPNPATNVQGYVLSFLTTLMLVLAVIILVSAFAKWASVLSNGREPVRSES
jgi:carbon starvation protein